MPENLPGLLYARKIQRRAASAGHRRPRGGRGAPRGSASPRGRRGWLGEALFAPRRLLAGAGDRPRAGPARGRGPLPRRALRRLSWQTSATMPTIERIHARQILDSRGNPTVEVDVTLDTGAPRPRRGAVGRLDGRVRGDRASRRRRRLERQGRHAGGRATSTARSPTALVGARATEQGAIDQTLLRPRRHAQQVAPRRQRDPRRLAGGRPRRRGRGGRAALLLPRRHRTRRRSRCR